jgi:putative solute:sodium symporter small subunit
VLDKSDAGRNPSPLFSLSKGGQRRGPCVRITFKRGVERIEKNASGWDKTMNNAQRDAAHWSATKGLMIKTLAIWLVFAFIIHFFAAALNGIQILGFPMGFYMAAQGSLIVFVAMLFWFASAQDKIDREFGVAED